ncbi:carbamoyltransferase [Mycobacterium antarcticum]|uniref:carbamoyltransferase HypF n=1 Tax=Mycolicibacterium sp. TUM20985 TaxID=3023370 RepID=UPI0023A2DB39|nr:carbamoyltransferase [Mycolicibacterium sp. TUM20985]GLP76180.1 carbamoyltransferase [Mycolicibacterium sp. TUM20983]GLP83440.1 carbamoyltransferase [Mycolicibacterium sp. TUM20984]
MRIARARGVSGFVSNDSGAVHCEFEGTPESVDAAVADLRAGPPPMARIDDIRVTAVAPQNDHGFRIVESNSSGGPRTLVPPDVATCADCLRELRDPADRRYRHPFITCTNCGPRYTVMTDLPYDRPATTMATFPMCERCTAEYGDPADRRFHAQTIACPDCGPTLMWLGGSEDPIAAAATVLVAGGIAAVKGIGGFHLACRADDDAAVAELRRRKSRPAKPFAVMVPDLATARLVAEISDAAAVLLTSAAAPIVLVPARPGTVSDHVAPGLLDLGVMLAYSPLHHLLFERVGSTPLVMTSANAGGSPIVFRDDDLTWIDGLADGVLLHDRPIHVPCEDSVLTVDDHGATLPLRRSRGYAPLPVSVPTPEAIEPPVPVILATGGDVKTTFCLMAPDGHAHLSSHLGDMADPRTQSCFTGALDHLALMTAQQPGLVACDLHPGYATTRWAQRRGGPVLRVQHHHAHAVSLLAEHGRLGSPVLAVAYDGTGYGTDGTIWGGELLVLSEPSRFTRVGHLEPFALPGGDGAARQPARIALDLMSRAGVAWDVDLPPVAHVGPDGRHVLAQQIPRGIGCVTTTSMGRLFDAVSSLLGVCQEVTYEGQAAIELEHVARAGGPTSVPIDFDTSDRVLDPAPVIVGLVAGIRAGVATADLAAAFHDAVIRATVEVSAECASATGIPTIGLTGGVFANRLLLEGIRDGLASRGFDVLTHRVVPCNDGGLALGQAVVAAASQKSPTEGSGVCASESPAR